LVAAVALVGALALVGVLPGGERVRTMLDPASGTGFFRLKLWRSTLAMIADHPVTGVGLDRFLYLYRSRYILPSARGEPDLSHPHNVLLDAWTRLGLAGVAVLAWLLVGFFRAAWRRLRTAAAEQRAEVLGLVAAMAAALAHGLVDQSFWVADLAFVFSLLLALVGR
jgi:O-antigen ligase